MAKYTFKTDVNCGNCVRSVTPFLNEVEGLEKWEVDTEKEDKILTAEGENLKAEAIVKALDEAGFSATPQ